MTFFQHLRDGLIAQCESIGLLSLIIMSLGALGVMTFIAVMIHSWLPLLIILGILGIASTLIALLFALHIFSKWMGS